RRFHEGGEEPRRLRAELHALRRVRRQRIEVVLERGPDDEAVRLGHNVRAAGDRGEVTRHGGSLEPDRLALDAVEGEGVERGEAPEAVTEGGEEVAGGDACLVVRYCNDTRFRRLPPGEPVARAHRRSARFGGR